MSKFATTKTFFDRQPVIEAVGRAQAKVLAKSGALVRKIAQRSMPYRKKPAAPGAPPSAHKPRSFLRSYLFFSFDLATKSVVVGPEKLGRGTAAKIQEFGGTGTYKNKRRTIRNLGDGGEIRIGGRPTKTTKTVAGINGVTYFVTFSILKTPDQVRRANEINEQLYGPAVIKKQNPAHPYMGPALLKAKTDLPVLWKDSVRG